MLMNQRENLLKTVRFERPDHIPIHYHINESCWHHYPQDALKELMATHPVLFEDYEPTPEPVRPDYAPWARAEHPYEDAWGCTWETEDDGIVGSVTGHPLADLSALDGFTPPDPSSTNGIGPVDWDAISHEMRSAEARNELAVGSLIHGHTFLRLCDLCGYEALLFAMIDENPRLLKLIEMVEAFNMESVTRYLDAGAEWISYPEDLGMQVGPMISPELFCKYIKPSYERLMQPAREAGRIVHMHSDGDLHTLVDDLIDGGVEVLNLQDLVNGIDWIQERLAGKVCIDLDIDRQSVTVSGTPDEIDAHFRSIVTNLGSKEGGLMLLYGLYPGTPIENAKAVADAMERYSGYYS